MKKLILLLVLCGAMPLTMMAQDDDLYFTPKKKVAASTSAKSKVETDKPAYYVGSDRDVDEYNRRGQYWSHYQKIGTDEKGNDIIEFQKGRGVYPDSTYIDTTFVGRYYDTVVDEDDYTYCRRMSRWDGWYDPWFYSYRWGYGPYWRAYWYDPWYYGGWYDPWFDPWYYGYGWGWPYYRGYWGCGWPYYGGYWCHAGGWGWPSYWGGGYITHTGGNPRGLAGYRTWNGPNRGSTSGSLASHGTTTSNRNGYTSRINANRSFGGRTDYSTRNTQSFGTRSNVPATGSSTPSFGGGSFGSSRGGFGGGHSMSGGGGGRFGGGRR